MTAFWIYTVFSYLDFIRLFFSVNFVKFLRTLFSQNVSCWLFLSVTNCILSRCLISIIIINHFDIKIIILTSFSFSFDTPELFVVFFCIKATHMSVLNTHQWPPPTPTHQGPTSSPALFRQTCTLISMLTFWFERNFNLKFKERNVDLEFVIYNFFFNHSLTNKGSYPLMLSLVKNVVLWICLYLLKLHFMCNALHVFKYMVHDILMTYDIKSFWKWVLEKV